VKSVFVKSLKNATKARLVCEWVGVMGKYDLMFIQQRAGEMLLDR
jgi:hypothetical protein